MQIEASPMSIYDPAGYPHGVPNPYGPRVHAWGPDGGGPYNEGTRYHGPIYTRPQWGAPWINQPLWGVGQTGGSGVPWGWIFVIGIAAAGAYWWFTREEKDAGGGGVTSGWYVRAYREGDRRPKVTFGPFGTKQQADARKVDEQAEDYWGRLTVGHYSSGEEALG